MSRLLLCLGALLLCSSLSAQLLTAEPVFPTADDAVTIFFDASQGTGGLENCNCDVYLHTGVITENSTSSSDWKYVVTTWGQANAAWKMTPVSGRPNVYSYRITPSIREYYGVPAGVAIERLAFVFRNATGSREGKASGGADIFYDLSSEALLLNLLSPLQAVTFVNVGENIVVEAQSNRPATLRIQQDGMLIKEVVSATQITHSFQGDGDAHTVTLTATDGQETTSRSMVYLAPLLQPVTSLPADYPDGLTELSNTSAFFQLHAPTNESAVLIGDFNNWQPSADYLMHKTADGTFWLEVDGLTAGQTYRYQYLVDETVRVADPLSTLVLDPSNDRFIPAVTFPDLPAYPQGQTEGIVSVFVLGEAAYDWQVTEFDAPSKEELVVYELLLRDFLDRHDYLTLIDTLDYLQRLGINAIELMPVSEFEGNNSWGYNPSFHMALDKYYGTPEAFKQLVDECHRRGIAVILDVVYNHAFSQSPLAQLEWNATASQPTSINPWLNPTARHPFNVGYDFNHESTATRRFIDRVMKYWLEEYRVDGFRFDLSKGFTQRLSSDVGVWSSYDASRIAILKHYAGVVWSVNPDAYVILEHFADNREESELINCGMLSWAGAGLHNEYLEAAMGYPNDLGGAAHTSRGWLLPHLLTYMESHDEERMVYKNLEFGNQSSNYTVREFPTALRRAELAAAFFYTIPGPKMLWQFGELGYDFSINTCENGTISENCRLSPKPIRWDYLQDPDRRRLFDVVSGLIHLKTNHEVFNTTDVRLDIQNSFVKKIFLDGDEMDVVVQGNFDLQSRSLSGAFSQAGWWYEYFTGDSVLVSNPADAVSLNAGEYRLYTSKRLGPPPSGFLTVTTEIVSDYFQMQIYPNPGRQPMSLAYHLPEAARVQVAILDQQGRRLAQWEIGRQGVGDQQFSIPGPWPAGQYWLYLQAGRRAAVSPLVVLP